MSIGLCNLLDSWVCVTKFNLGLGFLWKFDVVMDLCGLKKLRKEGKPMGSRERSKRFDPLETSSLSLLVMARI
jgi:hypothetical protein